MNAKDEARFWSKVDKNGSVVRLELGPCWIWTAQISPQGYGYFYVTVDGVNESRRAHRVAYVLANGPIPEAALVLHRCSNRACCNPAHLKVGTAQENADDRERDGNTARAERSRSRLHPETLPRGEAHARHILTEATVRAIRMEYRPGLGPRLAERYSVTATTIRRIANRESWRHLT